MHAGVFELPLCAIRFSPKDTKKTYCLHAFILENIDLPAIKDSCDLLRLERTSICVCTWCEPQCQDLRSPLPGYMCTVFDFAFMLELPAINAIINTDCRGAKCPDGRIPQTIRIRIHIHIRSVHFHSH